MQHIILTRFNLSRPDYDEWWKARVPLFEATLASVMAQTEQDFSWLCLVDPETKDIRVRRQLRRWKRRYDNLLFINHTLTVPQYLRCFCPLGERLLTTRLDNDDLIHPEFIAGVRKAANAQVETPVVLTYPHGNVKINPLNMFLSCLSIMPADGEDPITCWSRTHGQMGEIGKVVRIATAGPMWTWCRHPHQQSKIGSGKGVSVPI